MRKYESTGTEHNYLFSCGMCDNHRGICFLDEIGVYGVVGDRKPDYMDIPNFHTSYYNPCQKNPCQKDRWNVCVVYDTTSGKSSLWVNHGKMCDSRVVYP